MNRLNAGLAIVGLGLGALTIHYARAARSLREPQQLVASSQPHATSDGQRAGSSGNAVAAGNAGKEPAQRDNAPTSSNRFEPGALAIARHRLEELRNPQSRARRVREVADLLRDGAISELLGHIPLTPQELDAYFLARAERNMQREQARLECQVNPACDPAAIREINTVAARNDEAELLGPDKYAKLQAYRKSMNQDSRVEMLSNRLRPDISLPRIQVEKLVRVLDEESGRIAAEAVQYGLEAGSYSSVGGLVVPHTAARGAANESSQRMESATRYTQRLINRAATVLTAQQLAEFRALQDEALASYMTTLREAQISKDARGASRR